jgi:hypothetical protein
MTCLVGLVDNDRVWMGVDTCGVAGWHAIEREDMKMFTPQGIKNSLISYTTSFRMGQILMYEEFLFDELAVLKDEIDHKYMVTRFIPKVQAAFSRGGFGKLNGDEGAVGGAFLVAYGNQLFTIEGDYQVAMNSVGYSAHGSGQPYALGSLATTAGLKMHPKERILAALRAAALFSTGVNGPFHVANTKNCKIETLEK